MKKKLTEGTILFGSVIKWVFFASFIGVLAGITTAFFVKLLNLAIFVDDKFPYYFLFLPLSLFLSSLIVKYLAPNAEGHGTEKVIESVHKRSGKMNALVVPVKFIATLITIISGGSVGKEGPCAQMGAGISSLVSDIFRFNDEDRRKLVICGVSAGFASIFGTPIAGAIFGVEVLFIGSIKYDILLPSFVAGIAGYQTSIWFGADHFYHPLLLIPAFTQAFFLKIIIAGVFFGLCSILLIETLSLFKKFESSFHIWKPLNGFLGGTILIILTLLFSTRYLGLGLDTIQNALLGAKIVWYAFLLKILFTSITLNFGGSGGIVTPILFIGATAGSFFASVFNLDSQLFASIGLMSLLAGAANTPIAAIIMSVELFGSEVIPYVAIASMISFLITGHRSVYPTQILVMRKSSTIAIDGNREIEDVSFSIKSEKTRIMQLLKRITKIFK